MIKDVKEHSYSTKAALNCEKLHHTRINEQKVSNF